VLQGPPHARRSEPRFSAAPGRELAFGTGPDFTVGIEEELILVDSATRAVSHGVAQLLDRIELGPDDGAYHLEVYAALVELASPIAHDAPEGVAALSALRARLRAAGGTAIGAGLHPDGAFGDVEHVEGGRYERIVDQLRGLITRTPTGALHVHVGMPDADTAIRACNGMREHLPLLQALAANSPFWHGRDSGLATARAQVFRAFRSSEIPRAFASYDDYAETVAASLGAGDLPEYTYLWWDIRPHPRLGTIEIRGMDSQAALWSAAALAALIQGLARAEAQRPARDWTLREALMESSFAAARDGLRARLPLEGALRPVHELARAAIELARPHARDLGSGDALDDVERILRTGNGADRQRAAFARGGMPAVLDLLVAETQMPYA
jgi:carboxylate-amine ligase